MEDGLHNAIIESARIDDGDRGFLTAWLVLDYGDVSQGFGGHALYFPERSARWNYAGHFIWRCMEIGGVSKWDALKGKTVRVRIADGLAVAIGHIVKDDWFCPRDDFQRMTDDHKEQNENETR